MCNTGKVCNCLIQFLFTVVLSIEEHVFLVEYVFRESYGSLARQILLHQTFMCVEQHNLQRFVIGHVPLMG
jgi:hypothetical protein